MRGTKGYETALEANIYSSNTCQAPAVPVRLAWHVADKESQMAPVAFGLSPHGPPSQVAGRARLLPSQPTGADPPYLAGPWPGGLSSCPLASLASQAASSRFPASWRRPLPPPPPPALGRSRCLTDLSGGCEKAECGHSWGCLSQDRIPGLGSRNPQAGVTPEEIGLEDTDVPASCFHPPRGLTGSQRPSPRALTRASGVEGREVQTGARPGTGIPNCPARRRKAGTSLGRQDPADTWFRYLL